ncbi:hypothetical protein CPB84DRAFT_1856627 [Gymnopilus junonius]|uniref:Uncharacterized protein n=1 Tax=Gymnopilus junonius TaxID=109634 RepID=A0A9P5N936_GYMJU|nr:hypothetical protein CPB84DRAFT_1856627 [Gymnopilus junonius]
MPRPLPLFPLHLPTLMDTVTSDFLALSSTSPFVSSPLDDPSVSVSVSVSASAFPSGSISSSVSIIPDASLPTVNQHPFRFVKPIPAAVATDWDRCHWERELRQQSEASRAENEQWIKHTVLLLAYLQDTAELILLPLQDIKTWPTLNLMHLTHLPAQLGVLSFDELDLYVCSSHSNFWIPTVDHSMTIKMDDKIFIRRKGVQTGPHPSALVSHSEPLDATSGSFRTPTRKCPWELTPPSMRPSKIPHIDLTLDEPQVSPPSSPFQPLSLSPTTPAAS